ncbi:MAG: FkbM family methyltransferase [Verrucomicrobia bacterium]|nr:FkbM family methyltransferase [Verrucomicrobiota bacterium]MCH8526424.1 FkbM family methyltransferase [Kiritimatiellia bacterium]
MLKKLQNLYAHFFQADAAVRALRRIRLGPEDAAVDCGANVGVFTEILARRGAQVYAFEPNRHAFEVLQRKFRDRGNVTCIPKGVWCREDILRLYVHERNDEDPVAHSTGGSLLSEKPNISAHHFLEVPVVDLAVFIRDLPKPPRVLKMDVEGAECVVLKHLLDEGVLGEIGHVFVETHETKIPELAPKLDALKEAFAEKGFNHIDLSWG